MIFPEGSEAIVGEKYDGRGPGANHVVGETRGAGGSAVLVGLDRVGEFDEG